MRNKTLEEMALDYWEERKYFSAQTRQQDCCDNFLAGLAAGRQQNTPLQAEIARLRVALKETGKRLEAAENELFTAKSVVIVGMIVVSHLDVLRAKQSGH